MFKNIIFDWSGVIKDVFKAHVWVVNNMIRELSGEPISVEEFRKNWEEPYMNFWNHYYPNLSIEEEKDLYLKSIFSENCPKSDAFPGIVDLLKKLKSNDVKMMIMSADHPETILPEIKKFGLEGIFTEVAINIHNKSDEIHNLIERNKLSINDTIFVGDSSSEVKAGKLSGIKTASVTWGLYSEEKLKLANPDYLIHNIKELENILL